MADDTVQIRFGAETSGVAAGATEIKTQLAGLQGAVSDLALSFKALAGTSVAALADTAAGAKKALTSLSEARGDSAAAKQPKGGKSQMEAWKGDLRDAEEGMREHTGAWLADMQAFELQFWQGKLATASKSSKDYQQLVAKVDELTLSTHKTAGERQLSDDKKLIESKKGVWAEELAALQQYVADATKLSGGADTAGGKEAATVEANAIKENMKATIEAQIKGYDELAQAQQKQAAEAIAAAKSSADAQLAAVKQLHDLGEISAQSYFSRIEALQQQDTSAHVAALRAQLAEISANYAAESAMKGMTVEQAIALDDKYLAARMVVEQKITAAMQAGNRQLIADQNDAILKVKAQWDGFVDPMVTTFSDGLLKMAEGTRTFRQVMLDLGQNLLQDMTRSVAKLVEQWLWGEIGRKLATIETNNSIVASNSTAATQSTSINALANLKKIQSDAAAAAGAAYKAMAGIPPAPLWGIAAGAAAYAGVMAFEGMASAAGGFDIPAGVNPITQLHQREMVLPASLANPMRNFFGGSGASAPAAIAGGAGPSLSGGAGDAHLHYAPTINAPGQQSLKQMLTDQGADMISFVQAAIRNRSLKFA
jgi:hypothetical protein